MLNEADCFWGRWSISTVKSFLSSQDDNSDVLIGQDSRLCRAQAVSEFSVSASSAAVAVCQQEAVAEFSESLVVRSRQPPAAWRGHPLIVELIVRSNIVCQTRAPPLSTSLILRNRGCFSPSPCQGRSELSIWRICRAPGCLKGPGLCPRSASVPRMSPVW